MVEPLEENDPLKTGLILGRRIYASYPNSFASFMVCGKRGIGKSSYALKALYECYRKLGYGHTEAWDLTLDSIQFSLKEVVDYIEGSMKSKEKRVALIWDDCRVHASSQAYFSSFRLVQKLSGLLDTIRVGISCLILTCPSPQNLISILGSYDDYYVRVGYAKPGGWMREAKAYMWNTLPSGTKRIYRKFEDEYSCYLPNDIYDRYMVRRREALANAIKDVNKLLKEDDKKEK